MNGRRLKSLALVAGLIGSGLALLAWSQTWFDLRLSGQNAQASLDVIEVGGAVASPAMAALGLAGLALVAALAIAGPFLRVVLAILQILLGGSVVLAGALALGDPVGAVAPAVTDATGVAGSAPTAALVASADPTLWPAAAMLGGVLVVAAGLVALITARRWPGSSRRYSAVGLADAETGAPTSVDEAAIPVADARRQVSDRAVDAWDELSRGDDPTNADADADGVAAPAPDEGGDGPAAREGHDDPSR
ncbi:hypothetical protein BJ978_002742 [Agromyces terreus]|uniref:Trp biosynthesis-associated membrane protein n=1 Tax=Agromyces terreus TaxID=424795 RepID=A0A9X2H2N4_9MICO|nr:Trp biosynthesis-associated membrane protein [Agromyces terreus]MCP2372066.1 hypothetical protein [Agromyces terreus]